jgi:methionine-rich copper-binding protein CopC
MKPSLFGIRSIFAVVLVAGVFATLALAHNKLTKTEPADGAALKVSPVHVELWFAEKPDPAVTKITVKGAAGAVETGSPRAGAEQSVVADFKGKLPEGRYSVDWQTAGDDGHLSKGAFSFSVAH